MLININCVFNIREPISIYFLIICIKNYFKSSKICLVRHTDDHLATNVHEETIVTGSEVPHHDILVNHHIENPTNRMTDTVNLTNGKEQGISSITSNSQKSVLRTNKRSR